jgi:hypothetical protein
MARSLAGMAASEPGPSGRWMPTFHEAPALVPET